MQTVQSIHRCWGAVAGEELPRESRLARATTIAARAGGQVSVFLTVFKIKSALTVIITVVTTLINRSLANPKTQFAADALVHCITLVSETTRICLKRPPVALVILC